MLKHIKLSCSNDITMCWRIVCFSVSNSIPTLSLVNCVRHRFGFFPVVNIIILQIFLEVIISGAQLQTRHLIIISDSEIEKLVVITSIAAPQEQCHTLDGGWHQYPVTTIYIQLPSSPSHHLGVDRDIAFVTPIISGDNWQSWNQNQSGW